MNKISRFLAIAAVWVGISNVRSQAHDENRPDQCWPQWRGPLGTGVAPHATPPVAWSEDRNVRWKRPLPGKGHSTPIVWGQRVFVTTAVPVGDPLPPKYSGAPGGHDEEPITHRHRFAALAFGCADGRILWDRTLREALPHQGGHRTASLASPSPVTDGERLFVAFGSWGLYGLDLDGNVVWQADLGPLETLHGHGEGSSPALYGDTLVVNWDHQGDSFVAAFDKLTGRLRWKTPRERASSWTTPIVVPLNGGAQVIVSGSRRIRGYDLAGGGMIWECGGLSAENVVSSPVAGHGLVFAGSTYDRPGLLAIRLEGGKGDVTETGLVVWRRSRGAPYVPSPLLCGEALYFHYHFQGLLTRVNARTGADQPGSIRLDGIYDVFASPVAAAGRVYVTSREGVTLVLRDGDAPEVIARNRLDDRFSASPALAGNALYLRGERTLYCLAEH
jgi:outer membrane protein assembly factor BamB